MTNLHITALGAFIYGALYLTGVFVAGIVTVDPWAWKLALVSAGLAYLTQLADGAAQMAHMWTGIITTLLIVTVAASIAAGVMLLV